MWRMRWATRGINHDQMALANVVPKEPKRSWHNNSRVMQISYSNSTGNKNKDIKMPRHINSVVI